MTKYKKTLRVVCLLELEFEDTYTQDEKINTLDSSTNSVSMCGPVGNETHTSVVANKYHEKCSFSMRIALQSHHVGTTCYVCVWLQLLLKKKQITFNKIQFTKSLYVEPGETNVGLLHPIFKWATSTLTYSTDESTSQYH